MKLPEREKKIYIFFLLIHFVHLIHLINFKYLIYWEFFIKPPSHQKLHKTMPLILFSGFPSSGKTTLAMRLAQELENKIASLGEDEEGSNFKVILHNDESLGIRHDMYRESATEKAARGTQMSAFKRDISKNNIVIMDMLNYNKGFRYQLFCDCKSAMTSNCVVQVICPTETCFQWNSARERGQQWDEDLMRGLIARYEEPDGGKRWDSPLINVASALDVVHGSNGSGSDNIDMDIRVPLDEVWSAIALRKGPKPNLATVLKPATRTDYLQELDRLTNEVVSQIVAFQNLNGLGSLPVKNINNETCTVHLQSSTTSTAALQRMRRSYVALNRVRTVDRDRIIPLFVEYLNNRLED